MDKITKIVQDLSQNGDETTRKNLAKELRNLSYSLEAPKDTITRIISYPLRTAAVRTGIDLKLFSILTTSEGPLHVETLAKITGADASLLGRYLRYFASFGMIAEIKKDTFISNNVTKVLADPGKEATVIHFFDTIGPVYQATPAFLRDTNFADLDTVTKSPFQFAYKTSKSAFEFFPELPTASMDAFNKYMSARSSDTVTWLSVYPFAEKIADCGPDDVVFVDVGGGIGHQCKSLREKYPAMKGRVIVQDLEHPIEGKIDHPGVEGMVHSFFDEQPIKGARFYYLRAVLHDWPDNLCHDILTRLKEAMDHRSRILIEEMVLPNANVGWAATHTDLTMMANLAARERTQEQWEKLLDGAGLKIEEQRFYEGGWGGYEGIITVTKKV